MGRLPNKSKKASFILGFFKFAVALSLMLGLIYGVSYSVSYLSKLTLGELYVKTLPVSQVAGDYIERLPLPLGQDSAAKKETEKIILKLALLSDSHNANSNLEKALKISKEKSANDVIFLGDYSNVGTEEELSKAKKVMDDSDLSYYSIPGDHDLWKSGSANNFLKAFGERYQKVEIEGVKLILVDNSDNEVGVDKEQLDWFTSELSKLKEGSIAFVFMSNPLYNKNGFKLMGENSETVKDQANLLLSLIRNSPVKAVFAGDNHISDRSTDPEKPSLEHVVAGALAEDRNPQSPRFDFLNIYEDGSYEVEEVVL